MAIWLSLSSLPKETYMEEQQHIEIYPPKASAPFNHWQYRWIGPVLRDLSEEDKRVCHLYGSRFISPEIRKRLDGYEQTIREATQKTDALLRAIFEGTAQ